jgi:acyl-CoA carboxylase subunit alpha
MLVGALRRARIHGVTTNRDQLLGILTDPAFADMTVSTSWLQPETGQRLGTSRFLVVAGALMLAADDASRRTVQRGIPAGWRNVTSQPQRTCFEGHDPVEWWGTRDGFVVDGAKVLSVSPTHVRLEVDGVVTTTLGRTSSAPGSPREIWVDGPLGSARLREVPRFVDPSQALASGSLLAPMPGSVVAVDVADGENVTAGSAMLVLEAMKMQHTISAPTDGIVSDLVRVGTQVAAGDVLAVVSTSSTSDDSSTSEEMA